MRTTLPHDKIIKMYAKGKSTRQVADKLGLKKNSVLWYLRSKGLLRKNIGYEIEQKVGDWLIKKGLTIERQRGDAPYDIKCAGRRVDVKGAHIGKTGYYHFRVQYHQSIHKKTSYDLDELLLVFQDEPNLPMYILPFSEIENNLRGFAVNLVSPKYPMTFLGFLD